MDDNFTFLSVQWVFLRSVVGRPQFEGWEGWEEEEETATLGLT